MSIDEIQGTDLGNVIRGIYDEEVEPEGNRLDEILKERGLNPDQVASQIESRISAFLQRERPLQTIHTHRHWKHRSVRLFAAGGNPIEKMIDAATEFVLTALEGVTKPTAVDLFRLAEYKRIPVIPNEAIAEAQLVPIAGDRLQIEYNPNQPKSRIRFSLAHELAHTFFDDCHEAVRKRQTRELLSPHDWEIEMLCNIGAAELLMPIASFPQLRGEALNIIRLLELKEKFEVSAEALLLRLARITTESCSVFGASRIEQGQLSGHYRLEYAIRSRAWNIGESFSEILPRSTRVQECTAIGFTAVGDERWSSIGDLHVQCVGTLPHRGAHFPRVVGLIHPQVEKSNAELKIVYVKGDATQPRGSGARIIAHNVNDKAISWGAGFARAIASKWPQSQRAFQQQVFKDHSTLRLGNTFHTKVDNDLWTFQMVCQHGYGPSATTRIRYGALKSCLDALVKFALENQATVHMPRLGTGFGGAAWGVVAEIIDETLCRAGIPVMVYELPNAKPEKAPELPNLFSS